MKAIIAIFLFFSLTTSLTRAADKVKFGTAVRLSPYFYLPVLAAEEKGLWKENGLEAEWMDFRGGAAFMQALAARGIKIGYTAASSTFQVVARGVPVIIVSDLSISGYSFWVRGDSRLKEPKDLKGAKVGVSTLGSTLHAQGRAAARTLGLEDSMRFIAVGGHLERMAALKTGAIDAFITSVTSVAELSLKGEVRELVDINDYRPKEWVDNVMVAHKEFVRTEADIGKRTTKSSLQAVAFVKGNPGWSMEKMKALSGYSEAAGKLVHDTIQKSYTKDGKISRKALENVRTFLVQYSIIPKDKAPRLEEVYTEELLG